MSELIMPEADAIAQHLQLYAQQGNTLFFSGFIHALREARLATQRDETSGQKLLGSQGHHGSWLGAIGYFALLDQIGKCFKPSVASRASGNTIRQALKHFSSLGDAEIDALYALRCAFAHDYSLINVNPQRPSLTHVFVVGQGVFPSVVSLPQVPWAGDLSSIDTRCQTTVSLEALGDLVEGIVAKLHDAAVRGQLDLLLPDGADELVRRYLVSTVVQ